MQTALPRALVLVAALAMASVVAACGSISVDKDDNGRNAHVDIKSPFGSVTVQADKDTPPDTGLPVRPGARVSRDDEHDNANVSVQSGSFAVRVLVAKYEHDEAPEAILDYYRKELARYGTVTECRGNLDFKDSAPRCKQRSRDEMQLGAGTEADNHIVSVKPRGSGSEFALVHVRTRS